MDNRRATDVWVEVDGEVSKLLSEHSEREIDQAIRTTKNIALREMLDQAPVDDGTGRKSIKTVDEKPFFYAVGPTATTGRGFPYMVAVATGTNKYRNSPYDFGQRRGGAVRSANYSEDEVIMFMMIQKRTKGKGISIPPNQYDVRAAKAAEPKIIDKMIQVLDRTKTQNIKI